MSEPKPIGSDAPTVSTPIQETGTLMARLFVVPAVIVCLLLGVAVVVVLFGSTSIDKPETIADLLARIESDSGERTAGMLLAPRAKESWQASQELALRFQQKDKFLKADEVEPTAQRMISILRKFPPGQDVDEPGPGQQYFLMISLGRLGTDSGVETLARLLKDSNSSTRRTALQSLAEMRGVAAARLAVPSILPLLTDPKPAVQMVACATLASLAERGNAVVIKAVSERLESDREIQWNAAMTLARLGDLRGKMVLLNMLERGYWEKLDLEYVENGSTIRRKFTDVEISNNLRSAIEAVVHLKDAELAGLVGVLQKDSSVVVRDAARAAVEKMGSQKAELTLRGVERFACRLIFDGEVW
ncbi:MAG: HEAT repeat domain-containing protein [Planctomycetota bacterium]